MKNGKKLLCALLALIMVLTLSVGAFAADGLLIAPAPQEPQELAGKTVILHTGDVHGAIGGYAKLAALRDEYKSRGAEVILVDSGDFVQGSVYVGDSKGADAVSMMNALGYDIVTLGNHEFDYGCEYLIANMARAEFKVVCADVLDAGGRTLYDPNTIYTTASGVKLGFFGLDTPSTKTEALPSLVKDLTFFSRTTTPTLFDCAAQQVKALSDADLVICLSHLGAEEYCRPYSAYDLCGAVKGIDFIIDGHSHTVLSGGVNGEPIQSVGTGFANIGVIVIDDASKTIEDHFLCEVTDDMAQDAAVAAAAKAITDRVDAEYGKVFAKSAVSLNGDKAPNGNRDSETNNGDLITDAMRWKIIGSESGLAVDADHVMAITNGGGIRAWIRPGDVSKKDINNVLPFGNTLCVIYVTGTELLEALEASTYCLPDAVGGFPQVSGIRYTVNTGKPYDANDTPYPGSTYFGPKSIRRVTINDINGKAFDPKATYAVVTNDFCAIGGDTYYAFASATAQFDTGIPLDEAVMEYITEELNGVIGEQYAAPQGRITILTAEEPAPAPETPAADSYTVVRGDCLWNIAVRFYGDGMKFRTIASANGIREPWLILPGQMLSIPAA